MALLQIYAQLHNIQLDRGQLEHQFVSYSKEGAAEPLGIGELLQALDALGFDARLRQGKIAALKSATLPALMPTRDAGLMLLGKLDSSGGAVIQLAGDGQPKQLSASEFIALFDGQWIEASVKRSVPQGGESAIGTSAKEKFGIAWFWEALKKYRGLMAEILLASMFLQVIALITPLIFQVVIDKVLTHRSMSTLDVMVIALLGVSIFEVLLGAARHYLLSHTTNRVDVELGAKLFRHMLHLPLSYFESRRSGDTVARVRELENARNFLTGQALTSWLDLLFTVVYLGVMLYYSVTLTIVVVLALPILFGASAIVTPLLRKKLEDKFALGAENQAYLTETVSSMETLKSHAVEPQWQREWDKRLAAHVQTSFEGGHIGNATNQFIGLASKLLTVLLLWLGAKLVIDGELTVGGLIAFNMLAGRVNAPILKLSSLWQDFTQMKVSIQRLADIMDATPEPAFQPHRTTPPALEGRITFEHVTFSYAPSCPEVLTDLSFDIAPGEIVGLVGVSGAGKTTITRLIQRLYTPQSGRVLVDGMDLNLVDTSWLRRQIGVVGQDTLLFNRSVRENIALADPSLGIEAILNAAKLAGAHDFILQLPQGYDTVIGERGSKLSGGQRARIAIARALSTDPKLLLLDEATASLDYESERLIHDNMAAIAQGRTVVMVAHRLSTLRMANRILVLENGRLIESGAHAKLMSDGGRYASLYRAHQVLDVAGATA
ncbi:MAG: type I secretion system permease/ATPase [Rhodoferax sp.]|nr:type I secretion system permease/ATPase [Rhodoferax sp.]